MAIKGQVYHHRRSTSEGLQRWDWAAHVTSLRLRLLWNKHFPVRDELQNALDVAVEKFEGALLAGNIRRPGLNEWDPWFQMEGMETSLKAEVPPGVNKDDVDTALWDLTMAESRMNSRKTGHNSATIQNWEWAVQHDFTDWET